MFCPEKEVPSLELCKKLKEVGYPQDGGWHWIRFEGENEWKLCLSCEQGIVIDGRVYAEAYGKREQIKAPTCRELMEWLPDAITEEVVNIF